MEQTDNLYANIIVDISVDKLDRTFQYRIPGELKGAALEGCRVKIPFGKGNTPKDGYIYSIEDVPRIDPERIKDILEVVPGSVSVEGRLFSLAAWIRRTYGSTMNQALKTVLPVKEMRKRKRAAGNAQKRPELEFDPGMTVTGLPELTEKQQAVYKGITDEWRREGRPSLIHGITGSGKTYIYIRLIDDIIRAGKQAILLIPEISLTWQTVSRFYSCFGERVSVLHSRLSKGERSDLIEKVRNREVDLVIGPRSALFTPFPDLGLIIIDEEHEPSYQSEVTPRYSARETAVERARIENAFVVMGSATPSVDAMYSCRQGKYALFDLSDRYGAAALPEVSIVDMRQELRSGNRSILSAELRDAMALRLERGEQVMLFLNRRGHTGFISCRSCGSVIKCPHCDVSLTLHRDNRLYCHYCGYSVPMTELCPSCGSPYIGGFSAGTEQVEEIVKKDFPKARILRMDADTTRRKGSYEKILSSFASGKADILIGTQMIVKGHDFPMVTLVGILAADMSLFSSDYRSSERTYQLISQAVGRAGRGEKKGEAVIQTYDPEHFAITSAAASDYESFFSEEAEEREMLGYPPAGHMIAVHGSGKDEDKLALAMEYLKQYAVRISEDRDIRVLGPAGEVISRVADTYRMALYLKGTDRTELIRTRRGLEKYIEINRGFDSIQIQFSLDS